MRNKAALSLTTYPLLWQHHNGAGRSTRGQPLAAAGPLQQRAEALGSHSRIVPSSSVAQCTASDSVNSSSSSSKVQRTSFCWNGFCVRDLFKHSEAKWRVLPSLFSEALETGPTVYKSGMPISRHGRFSQAIMAS